MNRLSTIIWLLHVLLYLTQSVIQAMHAMAVTVAAKVLDTGKPRSGQPPPGSRLVSHARMLGTGNLVTISTKCNLFKYTQSQNFVSKSDISLKFRWKPLLLP